MLADGTAISRTTYAGIFAAFGTSYGAGDGSTTFNLPDLRGRVPVGKGTHSDVATLGNTEGAAIGDRRPKHKTSVTLTDPGHTHTGATLTAAAAGSGNAGARTAGGSVNPATTGITVTAGIQTNAPEDTPAYLVLNYIVKT